jgi:hypothetical protein
MILTEADFSSIAKWRKYPGIAANELLYIPTSSDPDDRYVLIPTQRIVANRVWNARSSIVVACRGFGKTRMAATLAVLKALLWPGRRIGCLSASFRQSKQIFEEIIKIWERSPILQQCTVKQPIISNDSCRLDFKTIPSHEPSTIRALPLADGSKIRGARFHTIFVDEAVHVPEDVFQMVIRPMAATHQDPVRAMRVELEKDRIRARGLPADLELKLIRELESFVGANQICMLTSGYYSFNYVYKLYCKYSERMHGIFRKGKEGDPDLSGRPEDYATFQIPHQAIPRGFLDKQALEDAENDMSRFQFKMEYEAAWVTETGGFFKASEIEACRAAHLMDQADFHVRSYGEQGKRYVLSIDPARVSDAFAMVISEFDPAFGMKIVYAEQHFRADAATPKMGRRIFQLCEDFNIIQVGIDKGGGGLALADFLATETGGQYAPLYDMEDPQYRGLRGRHIVKLVDFSSSWIEDAHHHAANLLERRKMCFPNPYMSGAPSRELDTLSSISDTIEQMIIQILNIQVSETKTGKSHFDLPDSGGEFTKHKDLYSAWLIGADITYNMLQREAVPTFRMPLLGIITNRIKF